MKSEVSYPEKTCDSELLRSVEFNLECVAGKYDDPGEVGAAAAHFH